MMDRQLNGNVLKIDRGEYAAALPVIKHVFLVGNLLQPSPHPFVPDRRVEMVICGYEAGDNGRLHWHREVTEYEWVAEGEVGYLEVATGLTRWFVQGDFVAIPPGACVQRLVRKPARTVTLKVPSLPEKVHCEQCDRRCSHRVADREEVAAA